MWVHVRSRPLLLRPISRWYEAERDYYNVSIHKIQSSEGFSIAEQSNFIISPLQLFFCLPFFVHVSSSRKISNVRSATWIQTNDINVGTRAFKMAHFRNECIICRSLHKFVIKFMIIYILEVITERQDPLLERDSCGHSKSPRFRKCEASAEILHCWWRICKKRSANWMKN